MTYKIANQTVRNANEHANKQMPQGNSNMVGSRNTFLATKGALETASSVTAGTVGGATGAGGKNQTVTASAPSPKGRAAPTPLVSNKIMKTGHGHAGKLGLRKTFI